MRRLASSGLINNHGATLPTPPPGLVSLVSVIAAQEQYVKKYRGVLKTN